MKKPTKRQMAVMIAKDVIAQISAKKYSPTRGVYISTEMLKEGDLQEQVRSRYFKNCEACALGSAMLSKARLFDEVSVAQGDIIFGIGRGGANDALKDHFELEDLGLIEDAFEQGELYRDLYYYPSLESLMSLIEDDADRLIFLMKEVIRQKGRFDGDRSDVSSEKVISEIESRQNSVITEVIREL